MDGTPNAAARRNAGYARVGPLAPRRAPVRRRRVTAPARAVDSTCTDASPPPSGSPDHHLTKQPVRIFTRTQCLRFRRVWYRLHMAAAARAAGSIDDQDFAAEVEAVNRETDTICARCGAHFRESPAVSLRAAPPAEVEIAVYNTRASIGADNNDAYDPPSAPEVVALYRRKHAEAVRNSMRLTLRALT